MKKINLTVGVVFTWIGVEKLTAEIPNGIGWFFVVMGILTILSAFFSFASSSSRSRWGRGDRDWGGPGGDDCGGGGE